MAMEYNCQWLNAMADECAAADEDVDKGERICWYESQDCNGGLLDEADEDINDVEDDNESSNCAQFLCDGDSVITNHGVSTNCTSDGLGMDRLLQIVSLMFFGSQLLKIGSCC